MHYKRGVEGFSSAQSSHEDSSTLKKNWEKISSDYYFLLHTFPSTVYRLYKKVKKKKKSSRINRNISKSKSRNGLFFKKSKKKRIFQVFTVDFNISKRMIIPEHEIMQDWRGPRLLPFSSSFFIRKQLFFFFIPCYLQC